MVKSVLTPMIVVLLASFSGSVAHAQVDKVLVNVASWVLQKQIEEMDKDNDPSRGLREYHAKEQFGSRDQFAPGKQPQNAAAFRGYTPVDDGPGYESRQSYAPVAR